MCVNQRLPLGKNTGKGLFYTRRIFLVWFTIWPANPDVIAVVEGRSKPTMPQPENEGGGWSCFILMTVENATSSAAASSKAAGQSDQLAKENHWFLHVWIGTWLSLIHLKRPQGTELVYFHGGGHMTSPSLCKTSFSYSCLLDYGINR